MAEEVCNQGLYGLHNSPVNRESCRSSRSANEDDVCHLQERTFNASAILTLVLQVVNECYNCSFFPFPRRKSTIWMTASLGWSQKLLPHRTLHLKKISLHLFCGPSPTRYSMTRSTAPRSLGRIGLANGGPGGCRPVKTVHKHGNEHTHTNTHKTDRHI